MTVVRPEDEVWFKYERIRAEDVCEGDAIGAMRTSTFRDVDAVEMDATVVSFRLAGGMRVSHYRKRRLWRLIELPRRDLTAARASAV